MSHRCILLMTWLVCSSPVAADVVLYESATLGQTGITMNGLSQIDPNGIVGARFHLDVAATVSQVGGHLTVPDGETVFAALIRLDAPDALPLGTPLLPCEVIAFTNFAPGNPSTDAFTDLQVDLDAGDYALLFGGGLFGATIQQCCARNMPTNNMLLPGASLFRWRNGGSGWSWVDLPPAQALRFVIMGETAAAGVPAASTTALLGLGLVVVTAGVIILKRRNAMACTR